MKLNKTLYGYKDAYCCKTCNHSISPDDNAYFNCKLFEDTTKPHKICQNYYPIDELATSYYERECFFNRCCSK